MADRALVVADDLTGATDTGHSFAARGYETVVRVDPAFDAPGAAVLAVDTDSRYAPPAEAARRVREAVAGVDAGLVYKKVDSTLRGNLGAEIEAARDAMDADAAAVAPAFPSNDRVTADGYHLVAGRPVSETEAGNDPERPVDDSHLPRFLRGQVAGPVSHVPVYPVATREVAAHLRPERADGDGDPAIVVFDAVHDAHLDAVAEGAAAVDGDVLLVGSAGLAEHARVPGAPGADPPPLREAPSGEALGVAGSVDPATLAQVDALPPERVVSLDAPRAVRDPDSAASAAAEECADALGDEPAVVLASARSREDVEATLDAAGEAGVAEEAARERVGAALAGAAERVWTDRAPGGLFLTGGAVATAVLRRLDAGGVALHGREAAPGVPAGEVRGGRADGTPLVTKAGAFGGEATVADALSLLRRTPRRNG